MTTDRSLFAKVAGSAAYFRTFFGLADLPSLLLPYGRELLRFFVLLALLSALSCSGVQTRFSGCMAGEKREEFASPSYFGDETTLGPTVGTERRGARALLTTRRGELVVHAYFGHACCNKASLTRSLRKEKRGGVSTLELEIRLSGRSCRCRCFSGMESVLALKPGPYRILLRLEGEEKPLLSESIVIPE